MPPRSKFYKTQWAWQGVKLPRLISIFTSKNVFDKNSADKIHSKNYKGWNTSCITPIIRVKELLNFSVTESQLSQCFAMRNWVVSLTITKTKAYISVLGRENSNLLYCEVFYKAVLPPLQVKIWLVHIIRYAIQSQMSQALLEFFSETKLGTLMHKMNEVYSSATLDRQADTNLFCWEIIS